MSAREEPSANGRPPSRFAGRPGRPVLVGGCPRSGTTLLRTMLDSHPELALPRETRFVLEVWARRRRFGDLRLAENRRRLAAWIFERDASLHRRLGLDRETAVERLVAAPPMLGSLLATPFVLYAEKHGKERWGDKRPRYAARLAAVFDLFPDAQFVNVVRDPRACVASMRRLGWYEGRIAPAVHAWESSARTVNAWRARLAPDQLLDVAYEELVAEPEATLGRLAAFAGVAADETALERMLGFHERGERHSRRYHANVSRPLDASRVSTWREALAPSEIAFVEEATRPLMAQFGYEPAAAGVSVPAELLRERARLRRRGAAGRLRLEWGDRLQKLLDRRPLAAAGTPPLRTGDA